MKKILYSAAAMALAFFAASCQQENLEPVVKANTVTYTVQVADAVATRALGDDITAVNELVYEVYRTVEPGETDFTTGVDNLLYHKTATITNGVATIELEFVNDQNFTVLFWAHTAGNTIYDVDDLTEVTIATSAVANNANAQAFVGRDFVRDCVSDANGTVTLKRAVSQLNIATTPESLVFEAQVAGGLETVIGLEGSSVTVNGLSTTFNIATLTPGESEDVDYVYTKTMVPTKDGNYETLEVNGTPYTYVSMNYVGFAPTVGANLTVSYIINTTEGDIDNEIVNVPVKPNYRTNIVGNLITSKTEYTITLEKNWYTPAEVYSIWDGETMTEPEVEVVEGEPTYVVESASDLAWLAAAVNGTLPSTLATRANTVESYNFVLTSDIDLNNQPWTPIGYNPNDEAGNENYFSGTFDGNGHTIKNLYIDVKDQGGVGFFGAVNNATIKNITFDNVFVKAVESESDPVNSSGAEGKTNYIVGGHIGAVAGYDAAPWGTGAVAFENVHVKGLVQIEGETRAAQGQRVGGIIGGRGYSKFSFKNVSVIGTEGSYIKGYCSTAGISGQLQGVTTYEDVTTEIDVYAVTFGAGGIAGIVTNGSTFKNCATKGDVILDASKTQLSSYSANYPFRVGGIAGCWSDSKTGVLTLENCSYAGTLTSIDKDGNSVTTFDYEGYVGRGYALKNCAGSTVNVNGTSYVQAYDDVYGLYTVEGVYEIGNVAALKSFAAKVNAGETFEGKTVKLVADLDLNYAEWTPIGSAYKDHGFMGNFNGNGKTIKNLQMTALTPDASGYVYAGLFGVTEGTETQENYIKNLTIENVTIGTSGHIVAAAIAYPYYTTVENVTVKGDINIKGGDYTAGVLAYTRRCVNAKNLAIAGNANSVVEGRYTVGGVISDIQTNGGLTADYSNFSASGLTVKGAKCVGGISGIISRQTLNGATVENVAIVSDDVRKGIVSGSIGDDAAINNIKANNVTGATSYVGATYGTGETCTLTIDGVAYKYLENGKIEDANGYEIVANGLGYKEKTYAVSTAEGLVTLAAKGLKSGEKVILTADIDLAGVEFNGLDTFHPENNNVFDGQGHKVSNWTNYSGASDMGFIRNWVGTIKNLTIEKASLKTSGRSAIVGAKVYGNIENCHVVDCTLEDSYWACGLIAGLYNAGNISNCSATNSTVKSNGGTGAIVGVVNETAGTRSFTNCVVTGCTVNNTGAYGAAYCGALVCGMINISNSTVNIVGCELSNNTKAGKYVGDLYYAADDDVTVVVE